MEGCIVNKDIEELTLLLLYLTSWDEKGYIYEDDENIPKEVTLKNSWKGYSFDVLNELTDKGYLYPTEHKKKLVTLTENGVLLAEELSKKYFGRV